MNIYIFCACLFFISVAEPLPSTDAAPTGGNEQFISACRQGFEQGYPDSEEAVCLGWGLAEINLCQTMPELSGQYSPEKGELAIKRKSCPEVAGKIIINPDQSWTGGAWFAWRDEHGIFNLVINTQLPLTKLAIVWQVADDCLKHQDSGCDWQALAVSAINPTEEPWLQADRPEYTWLRLGHIAYDQTDEMQIKIQELTSLGIMKLSQCK